MSPICLICLESLFFDMDNKDKNTEIRKLNICSITCGHVFHKDCILQWTQSEKSTCPTCRTVLQNKPSMFHDLYFNSDCSAECLIPTKAEKPVNKVLLVNAWEILLLQNSCLKVLVKLYSTLERQKQALEKELQDLQTEINELKDVQSVLNNNTEETDRIISRARSTDRLAKYACVLKRELEAVLRKNKVPRR